MIAQSPPEPRQSAPESPAAAASQADRGASARVSCRWTKFSDADRPEPRDADERNRAQLGRLLFARVDLECEGATVVETLDALREALGINLIVYQSGRNGLDLEKGIDPSIELDLAVRDLDGRAALEMIAAYCGDTVTWQLREGMVEFGPKRTLHRAIPSRRARAPHPRRARRKRSPSTPRTSTRATARCSSRASGRRCRCAARSSSSGRPTSCTA